MLMYAVMIVGIMGGNYNAFSVILEARSRMERQFTQLTMRSKVNISHRNQVKRKGR